MSDRLAALRPQERAACALAERVLNAVAEPWDVPGRPERQGQVDAMLTLPDGRRAAFEVTALDADGGLQIDSILGSTDFHWPSEGKWWWSIQVGARQDIPRLKQVHGRIARLCEAADVVRPEDLWRRSLQVDPDVAWLVEESSSHMWGHPEVPARDGDVVRDVMVVPAGRGGFVDRSLSGLSAALTLAFTHVPHLASHLDKVARADADERHLFIAIHRSALPFAVADGLWVGTSVPPNPPPLPDGITHLWLAPHHGPRFLLWAPNGWEQHSYKA